MFRSLVSSARSHPKTGLVALVLVLGVAGVGGLYGYAYHQWHRAQWIIQHGRLEESRTAMPGIKVKGLALQESRQKLDFCVWFWPKSLEARFLAARAARLNGDVEAAEAHLNACLKLQPEASEAIQLEFLLLRIQMGEVNEVSSTLFNFVENKHPETPMILETLARVYMHQLRYGPAYACLTRWIEADPNLPRPYHWRGWVLERLDNPKLAMADYERALELDPDLVPVRLRLAEMLLEEKLPLDALPHLERLIEQFPTRPDVMARLGQCRLLQGQAAEARKYLEAAVKELPRDPMLLLNLARLDLQEDHPVEAESWLRRAIEIDPADSESQYTLVQALQLQGRRKEAGEVLAVFEKHKDLLLKTNRLLRDEAEKPTTDPKPAFEIGSALLQIGNEKLGLYWLDQSLQRDGHYSPAHKALAEYFEKKGEWEKAAPHRRELGEPEKKVAGS